MNKELKESLMLDFSNAEKKKSPQANYATDITKEGEYNTLREPVCRSLVML